MATDAERSSRRAIGIESRKKQEELLHYLENLVEILTSDSVGKQRGEKHGPVKTGDKSQSGGISAGVSWSLPSDDPCPRPHE